MPPQLFLTRILNHHLAAPVDSAAGAVACSRAYPQAPITNTVAMELLVFLLLLAYFVVVR